jgi:hypothetical protein
VKAPEDILEIAKHFVVATPEISWMKTKDDFTFMCDETAHQFEIFAGSQLVVSPVLGLGYLGPPEKVSPVLKKAGANFKGGLVRYLACTGHVATKVKTTKGLYIVDCSGHQFGLPKIQVIPYQEFKQLFRRVKKFKRSVSC